MLVNNSLPNKRSDTDKSCNYLETDVSYISSSDEFDERIWTRSTDIVPQKEEREVLPQRCSSEDFFIGSSEDETAPNFVCPLSSKIVFPVHKLAENIIFDDIKNLSFITKGSHSEIYTGVWNNSLVVVKMLRPKYCADLTAQAEMDSEYSVLCRIDHPNIIRVIGCGSLPRKFIILERMQSTLSRTMDESKETKSILAIPRYLSPSQASSEFLNTLYIARDIASAMSYLHDTLHPEIALIHRDLKPDNIGHNRDGVLKIFDFGLSTCVRRRTLVDETYTMTGNTGSLRFMAPEVVKRESYTEKVDVYSFAILVWQLARGRTAFPKLSKAEFKERVVIGGERPKLDKSWPKEFSALLESCWHSDHMQRPSFTSICDTLESLIYRRINRSPSFGSLMAPVLDAVKTTSIKKSISFSL
mmetsp:Transcript_1891/g.1977  ORF Transcript_1891/g.1977 Transcript_1891/m.1977 type:complete len:415 (+) Transcript_1891:242-1486(+)